MRMPTRTRVSTIWREFWTMSSSNSTEPGGKMATTVEPPVDVSGAVGEDYAPKAK